MTARTLGDYLAEHGATGAPHAEAVVETVVALARGAVAIREAVTLGGVTLTAHLTPGHTRGATTWTMDVNEGGRVHRVVFFSSASINAGTRLTGPNAAYPDIVSDLEGSFAKFKAMRCDLFFAPHGGQFAMADKFARLDRGEGVAALVDPAGWKQLIDAAEKAYRDQLALEAAAAPGGAP